MECTIFKKQMAACNHVTLFPVVGIVLLFTVWSTGVDGAQFLLTAPSQPRYDSPYTVSVTAYTVYKQESVYLEYQGARSGSVILNSTVMDFEFDGVKTWSVTFPWDRMQKLNEYGVRLCLFDGKNKANSLLEKCILLTFNPLNGYIFIQTDKPVYTPRQTVKFRIIAVDEDQRLAKYPLKVDIKNDLAVVVDRMRYSAEDAFKGQEFKLPSDISPGRWSISANFEGLNNAAGHVHSVDFEVKEYVLPRFSATVEIKPEVVTRRTTWITIKVKSQYVYRRPVMGTAELQLGLWDMISGLQLLGNHSRYFGELQRGKFRVDIPVKKLFPKNLPFPVDKRLYVNVNVTENATMENDTIEDTSVFISHPYYQFSFHKSKTSFKPGFPYLFQARVVAQSGTPASWIEVRMKAEFLNKNGAKISDYTTETQLDSNGEISKQLDVGKDVHQVSFKIDVLNFQLGQMVTEYYNITRAFSPNNEYLHISMLPIEKSRDGTVILQYTRPRGAYLGLSSRLDRITLMVLSKGRVLFVTSVVRNKDGRSTIKLSRGLYSQTSPQMRLLAYYHVDGRTEEFVTDSLLVDTDDVCIEEISLSKPGGFARSHVPKKPKDKYNLEVRGGGLMKVGLVAVDTAVYLINNKVTLSRELMFNALKKHDQGIGIGDGKDMDAVFRNTGIISLLMDTSKREEALGGHIGHSVERVPVEGLQGIMDISDSLLENTRYGHNKMMGKAPPHTVRKYFPESWLFEELTLPRSGRETLNLTLPDSITSWSFMAVGLSKTQGVCVSHPLEQEVQKLFFVQVKLPYKVTRLEEVKVKITVYNYYQDAINVNVMVSGVTGLCFSANKIRGSTQNSTGFALSIPKERARSKTIKVIPLRNGDLTLVVDVRNEREIDVVQKQLYVVAEGQRIRKSITFVLDPEAKHTSFKRMRRNRVILSNTATIRNSVDTKKKVQETTIDLSMPTEVIRGTEFCSIAAFGDLMGDIITYTVVLSKSLMDEDIPDAEQVIGDLAPTVHALIYANQSGLLKDDLKEKGRRFVRHGVARLLGYRQDNYFRLTKTSEPATWLTAIVLKTLCHASSLAFVDRNVLINNGFDWLLAQVNKNGTLKERDWRLSDDSEEYRIMLSAEVLIAIKECRRNERESHLDLQMNMALYLEDNLERITKPMVLAKAAYALMLFEHGSEKTRKAARRLMGMRQRNNLGQTFWAENKVSNVRRTIPFWYHQGVKASSIEATAFALLVFLKHGFVNTDGIADWLVSQRNSHGAFVGALDSMAAIQALSMYSREKHGPKVDLHCNVTSDKVNKYIHSFKFTEKNAIDPASLNNIPVSQKLGVLTKGQGLGQMQVNVEYNIPVDVNKKCKFNVSIEVKETDLKHFADIHTNPLCSYCEIGCVVKEDVVNTTESGNETVTNTTQNVQPQTTVKTVSYGGVILPPRGGSRSRRPVLPATHAKSSGVQESSKGTTAKSRSFLKRPSRRRSSRTKSRTRSRSRPSRTRSPRIGRSKMGRQRAKQEKASRQSRKSRSIRRQLSASRKSICIQVCLQHLDEGDAGQTNVEVEMLTGYIPVTMDIEKLKQSPLIKGAEYFDERDIVKITFFRVPENGSVCAAFRAVDEEEVGKRTPASVRVTEVGYPTPSCFLKYDPISGDESLQVYCADFSRSNRGECRCYSGICSSCAPTRNNPVSLRDAKSLACDSDIAYQLQLKRLDSMNQWVQLSAEVVSVNKSGSHQLKSGDEITLMSPFACACPTTSYQYQQSKNYATDVHARDIYLMSSDVEKMVNRHGTHVYRYLLDESSVFMQVSRSRMTKTSSAAVPFALFQEALRKCNVGD